VIFDFDRTLMNLGSFTDWQSARQDLIEVFLRSGVPEQVVEKLQRSGFQLIKLRDELSALGYADDGLRIWERACEILDEYERAGAERAELLPGVREALNWLRTEGYGIGIVSSNGYKIVEDLLRREGLLGFFDAILARSFDFRMKPYPDQVKECMRRLGSDPERTFLVGDTARDIEAARMAGIRGIGVLTGRTSAEELLRAGAERVISSLRVLPSALKELEQTPR